MTLSPVAMRMIVAAVKLALPQSVVVEGHPVVTYIDDGDGRWRIVLGFQVREGVPIDTEHLRRR